MGVIKRGGGGVLADRAQVARGFFQRMAGLLTRRSLPDGEALIFPRCRSIHTCFMRFPIDVLFVKIIRSAECGVRSAERPNHPASRIPHPALVVKVVQRLPSFRIVWERTADAVIELPAGTIARTSTALGERLEIVSQLPEDAD